MWPNTKLIDFWSVVLRVMVGIYWLYFGVGKLNGYGWVRGLIEEASISNPIPLHRELLRAVVLPNWELVTILQTVLEILVGIGLVFGALTRVCAGLGMLLAFNLTLAVAFSAGDFGLAFWFYSLAILVNSTALVQNSGKIIGIDRLFPRSSLRHR